MRPPTERQYARYDEPRPESIEETGSSTTDVIEAPTDRDQEVDRRLRLAAARRDVTVRRYVLGAIEERLRADLDDPVGAVLSAKTDPVLAELWDNPSDAAYDRL